MIKKLIAACILSTSLSFAGVDIVEKDGVRFLPNKLVVKFKDDLPVIGLGKILLPENLSVRMTEFGLVNGVKVFSARKNAAEEINKIFEFDLLQPYDPIFLSDKLSKLTDVEWAEPHYVYELALTPNDEYYSQYQYAPQKIQAEAAWDITTGNSNIVIAIVDTGIYWDHPDLAANIWSNPDEIPDNGIDDDNNGFIDDIRGWDFGGLSGTPDNNPMEDRPDHGTHVAGIASAVSNNNIGVASIGFDCKLMAVKTSQDDIRANNGTALISYGYQGIQYAVDNGAKVVNCSWGSSAYSNAAQEVIDYAIANGVLVVGAAGNEANDEVIYPGRYNGAFSVGYSNQSDTKDFSSNFGRNVDVFAPGAGIYGTWQDNSYAYLSGSSMASPLVAGLAGLVFSKFPGYNPLQVAEQIRETCDNIEVQNPGYQYLMGSGRINAFNAVSNNSAKSVRTRYVAISESGDGDGVFESSEGGSISIEFVNYLNPTISLTINVVADNPYITVTNASFNVGAVTEMQSFNNNSNLFTFTIDRSAPQNLEVYFRLNYTDGSYSAFEWIGGIVVNPLYKTQAINDVALTVTSKGALGFNDYSNNLQGDGFKFMNGPNLLFEGGLMYGTSAAKLVGAVRSSSPDIQTDHFQTLKPFLTEIPGECADEQGLTIFNDSKGGTRSLGVQTELKTYSFADDENSNFIILRYIFKNTSASDITNFYAGLYFDWDMDENYYATNITAYNSEENFGYAYNQNLNELDTHVAMALLSEGNYGFYGIHNNGDDGGVGVYDGFTDQEKWATLTGGLNKTNAGPYDISTVVSAGSFDIPVNDSIEVTFSIAAAPSLEKLKQAVAQSRIKYNELVTGIDGNNDFIPYEFSLSQNYPNPFNPTTTIKYTIPRNTEYYSVPRVKLMVYDILGSEIVTLVNEHKTPGAYEVKFDGDGLTSGVYLYTLTTGNFSQTRKMLHLR